MSPQASGLSLRHFHHLLTLSEASNVKPLTWLALWKSLGETGKSACASHRKLLRGSAGEESDEYSILQLMDSQTEVCIFRLEIFPSFWRMRRLEATPTTVPHPRRGQRWGQPSCIGIDYMRADSAIGFFEKKIEGVKISLT